MVCPELVALEGICLFYFFPKAPVNTRQSAVEDAMEDAMEALLRKCWVSHIQDPFVLKNSMS